MRSIVLALALVAVPGVARAQVELADTKWSVFGAIGFDTSLSGNVTAPVTGNPPGLPEIALVVDNVSFSEVYGSLVRWHFGVGFRLTERSEILGSFSYSAGGGSRALIGPVYVGAFNDLSEKAFEVGFRHQFLTAGRVIPYVGGWGGIVRVNAIEASLTIPNDPQPAFTLPILDASSAGTIAGGGGIMIPVSSRFALTADVNIRWRSALNSANILVGSGLDTIGRDSGRWSVPAVFGGVVRIGPLRY